MKLTYEENLGKCIILTKQEAIDISTELKNVIINVKKKYQKYLNIHESGDATEEQQERLFYYENKLDTLQSFKKLTEQ